MAELDEEDDLTTAFVYAGKRIAALEITPSTSIVRFRNVNPETGTTYRTDYAGKGGRHEEFDPLGAQIPKTDPYITNFRLYADIKPPGKLYMNDASPFAYDNSYSWDGIQVPCYMAQRALSSGAGNMLVQADVYIKYRNAEGGTRVEHYSGKVSNALAGINQVWKGEQAAAAARGFFAELGGGLETAINAAFRAANYEREGDHLQGRQTQQLQITKPPQSPNVQDLIGRARKIIAQSKGCAEFLEKLMSKVHNLTQRAPKEASIQNILNALDRPQGIIYGNTIKDYYGKEGATVKGSLAEKTAQIELPFPHPFQSNQPKAVHDRTAGTFFDEQAWTDAQTLLHESFHLAGYTDGNLMEAAAEVVGVKVPDYSNLSSNDRTFAASRFWSGILERFCKPVR